MGRGRSMRPGLTDAFLSAGRPVDKRRLGTVERDRFQLPLGLTVLALAVICAAVTFAVALAPGNFAHSSPELRVAIEVSVTLVALLALHLVGGRLAFEGRLRDLALVAALGALAVTGVAFSAIPALASGADGVFAHWSSAMGRLIVAAALTAACFAPDVRLRDPHRAAVGTAIVVGLLVLLAAALPGLAGLPAVGESMPAEASAGIHMEGPAGYLILQLVTAALFAAAALGFALRADRSRDELFAWIGLGCVFAAFSRVHEFLFPPMSSEHILNGQLLRLAFGLALFAGACSEIASYQRRVALAAVLDERRRMARDLHDGLAQELAYIKMETRRMAAREPEGRASDLALAAERALEESRNAITELLRPTDRPFSVELSQVAEQLAARSGARLTLNLDGCIELDDSRCRSLLRIVREAVTNGVRHGGATEVSLALSTHDGLRVAVRDNGTGFEPGRPPRDGSFGLTSMRERAQAMGGELTVRSHPGEGTLVEVEVP